MVHILQAHHCTVINILVHPNQPILISASMDGTIRLWCLNTFTQVDRLAVDATIESLSFSHDGRFIMYNTIDRVNKFETPLEIFKLNPRSYNCS